MLTKILEIRNIAIDTYRKARYIINPIVKFIIALLVFSNLNTAIGFDERFAKTSIVLVLSLISAVTPGGVMVFFAMVLTLLHVYNASMFLAILILLIFIVLYAALMRFSNGNAIVAVLIPLLAPLNLHFAVPIILGCVATPVAIMPCACGVAFYYLIDVIKNFSTVDIGEKLDVDILVEYYNELLDVIIGQKEMYIVIVVFALVILVVFFLRRLPFDYSFLISIGVGAVVNIIGLLVSSLKFDISLSAGTIIFMTLICALIAVAADFMKRVLDYTAIEHVQFEDDDFYYYVKAVPKIKISMTNHNIRVLSPGDDSSDDEGYPDDEDYVSAYSEQAPGYDLYNGYDDRDDRGYDDGYDDRGDKGYDGYEDGGYADSEDGYYGDSDDYDREDDNMAMKYAMSDVEADYEEDFEDDTEFDDKT